MKAITPPGLKKSKRSTSVKSKAPYIRGKVMGTGDLRSRRAAVRGYDRKKALRTAEKEAVRDTAVIGAAAAAGFGVGRYSKSKKTKAKETTSHRDEARRMAQEAIKKQKAKKEKHHSR
jgi:hypothetical protein